jgi:hypothetical protein
MFVAMGLPQLAEIITPIPIENQIDTMLNAHSRLEYVKIGIIKSYIEAPSYLKVRYLYKILLCIASLDRPSKARITDRMGISDKGVAKNVDYLYTYGYITKVKRSRLIIPFQKYKFDTGYKLSVKGRSAIYGIIKASVK